MDAETKFDLIVEHHDNEVLPAEETVFENIVVEHVHQPGAQVVINKNLIFNNCHNYNHMIVRLFLLVNS